MVHLSYLKRRFYEQAQPNFWKYKEDSESSQRKWFLDLVSSQNYLAFVSKKDHQLSGFVIGCLVNPPEVYDAGLTLFIDDFCVENTDNWMIDGLALYQRIREEAFSRDAKQVVIVSGSHDIKKRDFLREINLSLASEWYVG